MSQYVCTSCGTRHQLDENPHDLANPRMYLVKNLNETGCSDCAKNIKNAWFEEYHMC